MCNFPDRICALMVFETVPTGCAVPLRDPGKRFEVVAGSMMWAVGNDDIQNNGTDTMLNTFSL